MKTKAIYLTLMMALMSLGTTFGQTKTEEVKVSGNCGMCKSRIEKAASSVEGVTAAKWDQKTKMAEITFDGSKTNLDKIEMAIAEVGHDTKMHKATDKTYNALPGCCKYERPTAKKD